MFIFYLLWWLLSFLWDLFSKLVCFISLRFFVCIFLHRCVILHNILILHPNIPCCSIFLVVITVVRSQPLFDFPLQIDPNNSILTSHESVLFECYSLMFVSSMFGLWLMILIFDLFVLLDWIRDSKLQDSNGFAWRFIWSIRFCLYWNLGYGLLIVFYSLPHQVPVIAIYARSPSRSSPQMTPLLLSQNVFEKPSECLHSLLIPYPCTILFYYNSFNTNL